MRTALRHQPGHPAATANLGALMRISGESEAAEKLFRATLLSTPDNVGVRLNLAADLLQEGRAAEALDLLADHPPPEAQPAALRHWYLQLSLAQLQLGRGDEARATLAALAERGPLAPNLVPLWHWRQVMLALAEGRMSEARAAAEAMERAVPAMGPDAVPEHQIMARYDLAKFWSGVNNHARAFRNWQEGHSLLRRFQPFHRAAEAAYFDALRENFSARRFREGPIARNTDPAPVFIVGMPRSGTTLCEQIIAAHPQAFGAGERTALGRAAFHLAAARQTPHAAHRLASLTQAELDQSAAAYLAELHALAPQADRIIDKMPGNWSHLGLVGLMLPGARIIHCVRDPRDIGLSIFTYRFHGQHGYAHDLGDLGWMIAQSFHLMDHWKQVLPNPILTVALADWVTDFDATLARVLAHIGLPHHEACTRFHEAQSRVRTVSRAQVRQRINARGLGRWYSYAADLAPLIAELQREGALAGWA
jgi:hypothetical protein